MNANAYLQGLKVIDSEVRSKEGVSKYIDIEVESVDAQDAEVLIWFSIQPWLHIFNHVVLGWDAEFPVVLELDL